MTDGLDAARALVPELTLEAVETLDSGERSTVRRVRAIGADGTHRPLIVKEFVSAGESWVRECAALETVTATQVAPGLVADGAEPPICLLEDLGAGPTVADALLGDDPAFAAAAVRQWAEAIAALHVASRGVREQFRAALRRREGDFPVHDTTIRGDYDEALRALDLECGALGVPIPDGTHDAVRELAGRLRGDTATAAVTPSDTCPDNNVMTGGRLVLLDFEGAQWRNIAWDVAYLFVPWPTCWCSWRLPDAVAAEAFAAYREVAGRAFPDVACDEFGHDVEAAAVAWSLMSTSWFLGSARRGDEPMSPNRPAPSRRAIVLHRLERAARSAEYAPLAELASGLRRELVRDFGDVALPLAPAFR